MLVVVSPALSLVVLPLFSFLNLLLLAQSTQSLLYSPFLTTGQAPFLSKILSTLLKMMMMMMMMKKKKKKKSQMSNRFW